MNDLTDLMFALPKGALSADSLALLQEAGLANPPQENDRRLILDGAQPNFRFIMTRPSDVPTFVEYGAADLGICGIDVLREGDRKVYEPLLLPFGHCRLSVAAPVERAHVSLRYESQPRVATTYPRLTREFFRKRGVNAELITLRGSVELSPLVGLADLIVDIVDTGNTLRANGLVELRTILHSQAVLIANRTSFRLKSRAVQDAVSLLREVIQDKPNPPTQKKVNAA